MGAPANESAPLTDIDQAIWGAVRREVASRPEAFLFEAYDWELSKVTYSEDLSRAVVWLDPLDPLTGLTIATEPMSVIVMLTPGGSVSESSDWQVVFQDDDGWKTVAPAVMELLPQELAAPWKEEPKCPRGAAGCIGWLQTALGSWPDQEPGVEHGTHLLLRD